MIALLGLKIISLFVLAMQKLVLYFRPYLPFKLNAFDATLHVLYANFNLYATFKNLYNFENFRAACALIAQVR